VKHGALEGTVFREELPRYGVVGAGGEVVEVALPVVGVARGSLLITLAVTNALRYYCSMIVSFRDRDTEVLARGNRVRCFAAFESVARRKLLQLEIAGRLDDLRVPPGNRLEALKGGRAGQHSIRINDQFRICFRWTSAGPEDVEIVDYP
jgi:proteic killer suppression protein